MFRPRRRRTSAQVRAPLSDQLPALISKLARLPDTHRSFDATDDDLRRYGFGAQGDAQALTGSGLPIRSVSGKTMYSSSDLHYLGIRTGRHTQHLEAMAGWARMLRTVAAGDTREILVEYLPLAGDPRVADRRLARVIESPDHGPVTRSLAPRASVAAVYHQPRKAWPSVPPQLGDACREVSELDFYLLQLPGLAADPRAVAQLGLGDCLAGSTLLACRCHELGVRARVRHGLLLSAPLSRRHSWTEVLVEGIWVPIDPQLLAAVHKFANLDRVAWPIDRSPGGVLLALSDSDSAPVTVAGDEVETSFWTEIIR